MKISKPTTYSVAEFSIFLALLTAADLAFDSKFPFSAAWSGGLGWGTAAMAACALTIAVGVKAAARIFMGAVDYWGAPRLHAEAFVEGKAHQPDNGGDGPSWNLELRAEGAPQQHVRVSRQLFDSTRLGDRLPTRRQVGRFSGKPGRLSIIESACIA